MASCKCVRLVPGNADNLQITGGVSFPGRVSYTHGTCSLSAVSGTALESVCLSGHVQCIQQHYVTFENMLNCYKTCSVHAYNEIPALQCKGRIICCSETTHFLPTLASPLPSTLCPLVLSVPLLLGLTGPPPLPGPQAIPPLNVHPPCLTLKLPCLYF